MRGPRSILLALLALLPGLAAAEPADPRGQVTFAGVVDDEGRSALDLSAEIDLDDLRLSGFAARGGLETSPTTLGYGELTWGDLRVGGGRIDDDWGVHLGYAPRFRWRPHRRFELRTRVDVALEGQNRDLLASMNRRVKLQIRLQQTVEGLSVVAISYYGVGLVGYGFKALKAAGVALPTDLATGLSVPLVVVIVWWAVRRLKRVVGEH